MMQTDILPHKCLSDKQAMYMDLKDQILATEEIDDLIPVLKRLSTVNDLKKHLIDLLDKQYNTEKKAEMLTKQNMTTNQSAIRSIFISLYSFNGIPSDVIHANIISFLPCSSYKKLPLISKYFRNIMLNCTFIYNSKGYKIQLRSSSIYAQTTRNGWVFDHDSKTITASKLVQNTINVNNIKHWDIVTIPKGYQYIISNASNYIQKLELNSLHEFYKPPCKFQNCKILQLKIHPRTGPIIRRKDVFSKLQCLELTTHQDSYYSQPFSNTFYDNTNQTLSYLSPTLMCLKLEFCKPNARNSNQIQKLKIPKNIEWLKLINITNCQLDVSECNKLIAVHLGDGIKTDNMIWTKDNAYVIPFLYCEDCVSYYKNNNKCEGNIKFIAFSEQLRRNDKGIVLLELHKMNSANGKFDDGNLMHGVQLFCMLMKYKFCNKMIREEKILQVQKLWSLQTAIWIKQFQMKLNYNHMPEIDDFGHVVNYT
eukprot:456762_1